MVDLDRMEMTSEELITLNEQEELGRPPLEENGQRGCDGIDRAPDGVTKISTMTHRGQCPDGWINSITGRCDGLGDGETDIGCHC